MTIKPVLQRAASTVSGTPLFRDSTRCTVWSDSVGRRCYANVQSVQTMAPEGCCSEIAAATTAAAAAGLLLLQVFSSYCIVFHPLPSNRQYLSYDVCLEVRGEGDYQNCSVLYCVLLRTVISTLRWAVLRVLWIGFCLTGPISLCVDLFVFVCICVFMFHTA